MGVRIVAAGAIALGVAVSVMFAGRSHSHFEVNASDAHDRYLGKVDRISRDYFDHR